MTIREAIQSVLKEEKRPLTSKEIYSKIIERKLYCFGATKPLGVVQRIIRRHCEGIVFPSAHPIKYFKLYSDTGKTSKYVLIDDEKYKKDSDKIVKISETGDALPEEKMQNAYRLHQDNMKEELIVKVMESDPVFFEKLVVNLLLKMGYGGNDPNAGSVTQRTNDRGIDGKINEDKLGLDKIYIQAKRYSRENKISISHIQQFIGAMDKTIKGVFITTSRFTKQAIDAAATSQKNIVLIDGNKLTELMIAYKVGINVIEIYETYKIDTDYFM